MAESNNFKLQVRDWCIVILFIAVGVTTYGWYRTTQGLNTSAYNAAKAWNYSESQIGRLKVCIDQDIKPCDLSSITRP